MRSPSAEVVAYTRPAQFSWFTSATCPYDRVVALRHDNGYLGDYLDERETPGMEERPLTLAREASKRLITAFQAIQAGQEVNCHKFTRYMLGLPLSSDEPLTDVSALSPVDNLPLGAAGLISLRMVGVAHSIGYGMGDESLQVMSENGELGFVANQHVIEFYSDLFEGRETRMYQLPV